METTQTLLIITHLPDETSARTLASHLIQQGLAACVNIQAPCRSIYCWQGAIEDVQEIPLLIKTTADRYAIIETSIREQHPYELPDIVAVPVSQGLPAYLAWIVAETSPRPSVTTPK